MGGFRPSLRAPVNATVDFDDSAAAPPQRFAALAIAALLVLAATVALLFGTAQGPEIRPLIPIAVTVWLLADLLTAFLLLAQFYVNGRLLIAVLAVAYAFSGLLSCAYLASFPGVFRASALPLGEQQVSVALWLTWHAAFPVFIMGAAFNDSAFGRLASRERIRLVTGIAAVAPIVAASAVTALLFAHHDALPHFVNNGHFEPVFRTTAIPSIVILNVLACIVLLGRRRRLTALSMWLAIATLSAALDALLNLGAGRYTYAWDTGKCIAVVTGCAVLLMMLCDVVVLYGRLARVARVDSLTSLPNRRAFEEHLELMLHDGRRKRSSIALLMIDIDVFKHYNDTFGHPAGDECLRRVARAMFDSTVRPLDLVARYGGEEFVVLLPETQLEGARLVAERIRAAVSRLEIRHGAKELGRVTVSVGIAFAADARGVDETSLVAAADDAVYDAKRRGRNRVALCEVAPAMLPEQNGPQGAGGDRAGLGAGRTRVAEIARIPRAP
jgi:diguanylate cyclase (GGDEF)-like protein